MMNVIISSMYYTIPVSTCRQSFAANQRTPAPSFPRNENEPRLVQTQAWVIIVLF